MGEPLKAKPAKKVPLLQFAIWTTPDNQCSTHQGESLSKLVRQIERQSAIRVLAAIETRHLVKPDPAGPAFLAMVVRNGGSGK